MHEIVGNCTLGWKCSRKYFVHHAFIPSACVCIEHILWKRKKTRTVNKQHDHGHKSITLYVICKCIWSQFKKHIHTLTCSDEHKRHIAHRWNIEILYAPLISVYVKMCLTEQTVSFAKSGCIIFSVYLTLTIFVPFWLYYCRYRVARCHLAISFILHKLSPLCSLFDSKSWKRPTANRVAGKKENLIYKIFNFRKMCDFFERENPLSTLQTMAFNPILYSEAVYLLPMAQYWIWFTNYCVCLATNIEPLYRETAATAVTALKATAHVNYVYIESVTSVTQYGRQ